MEKLRTTLLYADVSDCKMNEGSLRCDVNVSVRKIGAKEFGTRTEMKNINSFNFATKAAEYEAKRQIKLLENGEQVIQETRRWDDAKSITLSMRSKEEAHDYRYFPEPDLMPIVTTEEEIEAIRSTLPEMPDSRKERYLKDYSLKEYDANLIVASLKMAEFFESAAKDCKNPKSVANWIISEIFSRLTEEQKEQGMIPFDGKLLGELVNLIEVGVISNSIGKTIFAEMWDTGKNPAVIVEEKGLKQISDNSELETMAKEVIESNPKPVADYLGGKDAAIQALMGQMMRKTKGKANPKAVISILKEILEGMK